MYPQDSDWVDKFYDEHWEKIAQAFRGNPEKEAEFLIKILNLKESNSDIKLLDLGCGYGRLAWPLCSRFPKIKYLGIDKNTKYIYFAQKEAKKKELRNAEFQCADIRKLTTKLPQDKYNSFDYAIAMFGSFSHDMGIHFNGSTFDNPKDHDRLTLKEVAKFLKPGGMIVLDQDNYNYIKLLSTSMGKCSPEGSGITRWDYLQTSQPTYPDVRFSQFVFEKVEPKGCRLMARLILYSKDELCGMLKEAGFEDFNIYGDVYLKNGKPVPEEDTSKRMVVVARLKKKES